MRQRAQYRGSGEAHGALEEQGNPCDIWPRSMDGRQRAAALRHRTSPEAHRMSISVTSKTRGRQGDVTNFMKLVKLPRASRTDGGGSDVLPPRHLFGVDNGALS